MLPLSLHVAEKLEKEGISVEVVDPMWLVPLDKELILNSVRKTEHAVIVQEAVRRGGVASDIASVIVEEAFDYLDAPVKIVAGKNTPIPFNEKLEKSCIPGEADIEKAVKECLYDRR
jgi:pyruvate dehydrogenase E1 component beta subunit